MHRERRVPDPGVAVVPVPLAADLLRQGRGRGRDQRAGRGVGHQLQRDRRALHHLPPPARVRGAGQPGPPELDGGRVLALDLLRPDLPRPAGRPLQDDPAGLPGRQRQPQQQVLARRAHLGEPVVVRRPDRVQRQPGVPGAEHGAGGGQLRGVLAPAVVEPGRDLDLERQLAADAAHHPDQPVLGGRQRTGRRHEVDDLADPVLGQEPGDQHRGVGQVELLGHVLGADRADPAVAAPSPGRAGRRTPGRVEPRAAEPVDRAVGRHQRRGVQVADQAVLGDGQ